MIVALLKLLFYLLSARSVVSERPEKPIGAGTYALHHQATANF